MTLATRIWHIEHSFVPGYMLTCLGALVFAYLGRNWIFHGLMLLEQSLVFYAGGLLAVGLWPRRHPNTDPACAHVGSIPLERVAFFVVAVTTLIDSRPRFCSSWSPTGSTCAAGCDRCSAGASSSAAIWPSRFAPSTSSSHLVLTGTGPSFTWTSVSA